MSGQLHVPAALSPVPIAQEAEWAPEPVWTTWRGQNPTSTGTRTPTSQPPSPYRLRYPGSLSSKLTLYNTNSRPYEPQISQEYCHMVYKTHVPTVNGENWLVLIRLTTASQPPYWYVPRLLDMWTSCSDGIKCGDSKCWWDLIPRQSASVPEWWPYPST
jgi:hypothetical protein